MGTGCIGFKPWEERNNPELTASAIIRKINGEFAKIPEARVFALGPPAIPGISAAGGFSMFLQDRSGGRVGVLAPNVNPLLDEARKGPQLVNLNPQFSPPVPQPHASVEKRDDRSQAGPRAE